MSPLPWGYLIHGVNPCATDPYCATTHPIFNLSSVAVLHLTLDPASLLYLLAPRNAYNGTWVEGVNVTLVQTARYVSSQTGAKMKLGGSYSKRLAKKGWIIKLPAAVAARVSKLKTKSGVNDASLMNSVVVTDAYRSLGVPVPRVCAAEVFVNGVFQGISMLYEEVEKPFLDAWFGHSHGNLYKMDAGLVYAGDHQSDYDGHGYEQQSGDGDWSDFLTLVQTIAAQNATQLERIFDVDTFLRAQAVEALLSDGDGWACSGHNSYIYNAGDAQPYFVFFRHDLDDSFGLKSNQDPCHTKALTYWARLNLTLWGTTPGYCNASPLAALVLAQPAYRQRFLAYAALLLQRVVVPGLLMQRVDALYALYAPYMVHDALYALDYGDCGGNADFWYALRNFQFAHYLQERAATFSSP